MTVWIETAMVRYLVFKSTVKTAGIFCGSMSCIVLRGHFNDTVVLSVHLQTEDKCDDSNLQFLCGIRLSVYAHTVHSTHASQVIRCSHNTDVCMTSLWPHWTKCIILANYWLLAPWWWFPCEPKHVGAASLILKCFNNSTFLTLCALVGHYSVWCHWCTM
jgi:hypothetical protein